MVLIRRLTGSRTLGSRSASNGTSWYIGIILQAFYFAWFLTCFLLIASLFDEADAPDHHGDLTTRLKVRTQYQEGGNYLNKFSSQTDPPKIAYAVTLTNCGSISNQTTVDPKAMTFEVAEGAAVLAHSIHRASVRSTSSGLGGKYDYELVVIYHPDASSCVGVLGELGYKMIKREVFINVDEVEGEFYRETVRTSGCCGEKELIKMEAYTLQEYPVVMLIDLDCLILKPLDALFDYMIYGKIPPPEHLQWPNIPLPEKPSIMYTLDYAMVSPQKKIKPFQGGFLIIRPDMNAYENIRALVKKGDYRKRGGWEGKTGKHWGGQTIQGLLPYYYLVLHANSSNAGAVEVNRCIYNNMAPNIATGEGRCYVPEDPCKDCRLQPLTEIASTHFTNCLKPWHCQRGLNAVPKLCRILHHEWFQVRSDMEKSWGRSGVGAASKWTDWDHFFGYCTSRGSKGYMAIQKPYGSKTSD